MSCYHNRAELDGLLNSKRTANENASKARTDTGTRVSARRGGLLASRSDANQCNAYGYPLSFR